MFLIYAAYSCSLIRLGSVDLNTVEKIEVIVREEDKIRQERYAQRPPISEILNLHDFEVRFRVACLTNNGNDCVQAIARQVMNEKAWAYYSSAADDEITIRENHAAYHRCVGPK